MVEVPPHVTMIMYRNPNVASSTLLRSFCVAFWCSLIGTIAETATILGLYGALWYKWTLTLKILIPILHCVFTAAQLWGEKCTWDLWQQEKRKAARGTDGDHGVSSDTRTAVVEKNEKQTKMESHVEISGSS